MQLRNFYPRSPRGERRTDLPHDWGAFQHFYPRSPRGERRGGQRQHPAQPAISIHAPREGSDPRRSLHVPEGCHFYPRSP